MTYFTVTLLKNFFSLMIAMAWTSYFSRNYDSKIDFSKRSMFLYPCLLSQYKMSKDILVETEDKF